MTRLADFACRAVLRLYPRDIRDAHGAEMRETFLEVCAMRSSIPELGNLAMSAVKARAGYPRIPSGQEPMQKNDRGSWLGALASDLRQALRALSARPGTTALAVGLLALAIAACTAVFTVADAVIFNQVPFRDAERIACVGIRRPGAMFPSAYSSAPLIRAWRDSGIFERVEAHETLGATLDEGTEPSTEPAARVTSGLFDLLGVAPLRGRLFSAEDAREALPPVLISEGLWRSHFAADEGIVGRSISIDGRPSQVVGVMPAHFRFPHGRQVIWKVFDLEAPPKDSRNFTPVAKLRAAMPRDEAARRALEIARVVNPNLAREATAGFNLPSGGRAFDDYTLNTIRVLFTGVLLVLLVACVNVANLLLAQALGRRRERAVRTALGASRLRLVRQALLESTAIATIAAGLGLALAWVMIAGFDTLLPEFISTRTINAIDLDRRAAGLVVALSAMATIAAGALPAWLGTRAAGGAALKDGDRSASEGRAGRRIATTLIVGEIAVSVALLAGAVLMVRSFVSLASAERGIDTRGIVRLGLALPEYQEADAQKRAALSTAVYDRIASLPGVEQITRSYGAPPSGGMIHFYPLENDEGRVVETELTGFRVMPDFFHMFRMELRAGRLLRDDDPESAVVVGESLAARLWPGVPNVVGRTFKFGPTTKEIVGITREVRTPLLDPRSDTPEYFELYKGKGTSFMIRFREGAAVSDEELKAAVRSVHPKYIVQTLEPVDQAYDEMIERPRAAVMVATSFAAFGMLVCAAGLFSVLSLSVARRRREFGIRLAVGAHPSQLSALVMRQTAIVLTAGIVLGIGGAFALTRNLSAVLAGVDPSDTRSWLAVVVMVAIAGAGAAWLPVRDARRTDPLLLLREE